MGDFLRIVLDSIQFLWPFRLVEPWERAVYVVCGKWTWEVGPGVYPILPWFCAVKTGNVVPALVSTPRQDITLTDGKTLSFATTANVRIVNLTDAYLRIDDYHSTTQETISAVLAEKLAEVAAERVTADKRRALLTQLRKWVNQETNLYGVEVEALRFTNFIVNVKTIRLLQESGGNGVW